MRVLDYGEEDLEGSLLLIGFPSRGLVGPIVAAYVLEELDMWPVAGVLSEDFPPTVAVRDGQGGPPVQFYVSAERCGPDGRCDKLLVLNPEIPIQPDQAHEFARAVLDWAQAKGVRCVVAVEGVEFEAEEGQPNGRAIRAAGGENKELTLKQFRVEPLPDGVITSHSSAFLLAARERGLDIVCLFVDAEEEADQVAASEILVRIDSVIPNLDLSSKEFRTKVQGHRKERSRRHQEQAKQMREMRRSYEFMYQ